MIDVLELLSEWGIPYQKFEHEAYFTCEDGQAFTATHDGGHAKNLFLRNKNGNQHYLLIVPQRKKVDLITMAKLLNESKLSFGSPGRLLKYLELIPGSVSPFGLINDTAHHVKVFIDAELWQQSPLYFHPNRNTATLAISTQSFQDYLVKVGNAWEIVSFPEASTDLLS